LKREPGVTIITSNPNKYNKIESNGGPSYISTKDNEDIESRTLSLSMLTKTQTKTKEN